MRSRMRPTKAGDEAVNKIENAGPEIEKSARDIKERAGRVADKAEALWRRVDRDDADDKAEQQGALKALRAAPALIRGVGTGRRGVAQPGSASALGAEGRRFESCLPDHRAPSARAIAAIASSARRANAGQPRREADRTDVTDLLRDGALIEQLLQIASS